jgi:NADP-dependent 3-hydroxy acid dehydrogenase YdfG
VAGFVDGYLFQLVLPYLAERRGNIVNVSSIAGLRAYPGLSSSLYTTSRGSFLPVYIVPLIMSY